MTLRIGFIGFVGEMLKQEPWGTLSKVAEMGYEGMEGASACARAADLPLPEARERLAGLGLAPVAEGGLRFLAEDHGVEASIERALAVGAPYISHYWGPCESIDELRAEAAFLDDAGRRCREAGVRLLYHNHNHEFATFGQKTGIEILMESTDAQNLGLELDIAWATYAGADPADIIRTYAGRVPVLHVKDIKAIPGSGNVSNDGRQGTQFTEVGTGIVDTTGAVAAARDSGVQWLVVEQDRLADLPALESLRVSHDNLRAML